MDWRENVMDFFGGDQGRPLIGLAFALFAVLMFALFVRSGGLSFWSALG